MAKVKEKKTLAELRSEQRYTLKQVAEGTGIPFGSIVAYNYGSRKIPLQNAKKIADFFGISVEEIKE